MKATSSILDLGHDILTAGEDTVPITVTMTPGYHFSKVTVVRRTVVQPHSVDSSYPSKHVLSSRIYGQGQHVTLKVINDSDFVVT